MMICATTAVRRVVRLPVLNDNDMVPGFRPIGEWSRYILRVIFSFGKTTVILV